MRGFNASRRRLSFGIAFLAAAAVAATMVVSASSAVGPAGHRIKVDPRLSAPQTSANPNAASFGCQTNPIDFSAGAPRCYTASQIQVAYGLAPLLAHGVNGHGRTIVIVDAFSNPFIANDLQIFDHVMGLPAPPSFTQIAPAGAPPAFDINDANQVSWAIEITLDVEWAHAMAPGANIVLAMAKSNDDVDIYNTLKAVIDHNLGDVISMSFGENESCVAPALMQQQHALFDQAAAKGITLLASTGDSGAAQVTCDGTGATLAVASPASDPDVTGVGGTTLNASAPHGDYIGETAWTEVFGCNPPAVDIKDVNCSGGGFSHIFGRPSFQALDVHNQGRGVPDVSYNAGVNGGVLIHCGVCNILFVPAPPDDPTIFFIIGGTSAGPPQWAGLVVDAAQLAGHRLGNINGKLYRLKNSPKYGADFHDITTGNNKVVEIGTGFNAGTGWDPVTGIGSPNAVNLLPDLIH